MKPPPYLFNLRPRLVNSVSRVLNPLPHRRTCSTHLSNLRLRMLTFRSRFNPKPHLLTALRCLVIAVSCLFNLQLRALTFLPRRFNLLLFLAVPSMTRSGRRCWRSRRWSKRTKRSRRPSEDFLSQYVSNRRSFSFC